MQDFVVKTVAISISEVLMSSLIEGIGWQFNVVPSFH